MKVGFIGQGFIGKSYADDFEKRGYAIVRYTKNKFAHNRAEVGKCDIVFIAVPAATTPKGFDDRILHEVLALVGDAKIAVVKCTTPPGWTERAQKAFSKKIVLHSPEFLVESTAAYDAAHPTRNIIGLPKDDAAHRAAAQKVMDVLPKAPFHLITSSRESELIKYAANCFLYTKVVFANLFHDIAKAYGVKWDDIRDGLGSDPRIGMSHLKVVDASRHNGAKVGRGAGGHCFIKDFAAVRHSYERLPKSKQDKLWLSLMRSLENKNNDLLIKTGKDIDLLRGVYGEKVVKKSKKGRR
jgi:nucleotide sugar dehydrogenase